MARVETIVQPGFKSYNEPYTKAIKGMQREWDGIKKDDKVYNTHDLTRRQNIMDNYYDHMKLDEEFLMSSENWNKRFRQRELVTQRQGTLMTNDKVKDYHLYPQYCKNMGKAELFQLPENDCRETHQWAQGQLDGHRVETHPLASSAYKRILQFSDWLGVTDRYNCYRHNMNRPNNSRSEDFAYYPKDGPPMNNPSWASEVCKKREPIKRFYLQQNFDNAKNIGMLDPPGTKSHSPVILPVMTEEEKIRAKTYSKTPQEWIGLNINYPNPSEYKLSYIDHLKALRDVHTRPYTICPNPDFTIVGKPAVYPPEHYRVGKSEYRYYYNWPNGETIRTKPWAIGNSVTKFNPPTRWDRRF